MTSLEALEHFKLAPLKTRRDIAMLGVVFRAASGSGPEPLRRFFVLALAHRGPTTRSADLHNLQLQTYRTGGHLEVVRRSVLGAVDVFNSLPPAIVEGSSSVRAFQAQLQELVITTAHGGEQNWQTLLSANSSSWERKALRKLRGWTSNWMKKQ